MEYDWKNIVVVEEKKSSQLELIVSEDVHEPLVTLVEEEPGFEYKVDLSDLFDEPTNPTYVKLFDDVTEKEYDANEFVDTHIIDQQYVEEKIRETMLYTPLQKDEELSRWASFNTVELMLYHNLDPMRHDNVDY